MNRLLRSAWIMVVVLVLLLAIGASAATAGKVMSSPSGPAVGVRATADDMVLLHAYTPFDIRAAYGLDKIGDPTTGTGLLGKGQTIVLVDSYGSPTAAEDLQYFHDTFYPALPDPYFDQVFPLGRPDYQNTAKGNGVSGPALAFGWSQESTLDIEWAYAVAPLAHIILVATPPAENLGVQGVPNMMIAINQLVKTEPAGTVFSQSFGVSENSFGAAARRQMARFDRTYRAALAKGDTVLCASGDWGTTGFVRAHKGTPTTTVEGDWPSSSPYVTAVGGTQLQMGWTWKPLSDIPFTADGDFTTDYFNNVAGTLTEVVWNESWLPAATGGGMSTVYARPAWQDAVAGAIGADHRGYPDLSWNAAVNGGVLVYLSAFPNWLPPDWYIFGGTSASCPQVAALVALANEKQAKAGEEPVGYLNPLLYQIGASAQRASVFRDILPTVQGTAMSGKLVDNGMFVYNEDGSVSPGPVPGVPVLEGWDMTTGWGSPLAPAFIDAVCAARNAQ